MLPVLSSPSSSVHEFHDNPTHQMSTAPSKRGSNSIFRIEHFLPSSSSSPLSSSSATTMTTYDNAMDNGATRCSAMTTSAPTDQGVFAAKFTPKDITSTLISTDALMYDQPQSPTDHQPSSTTERQNRRFYCRLTDGHLLVTPTLLRKIKLSDDVYSHNAIVEVINGDVRMRVVRDIAADEEVITWFSKEATLLMSIPFLTPFNIQGNNRYTCHLCNATFEHPNPLKIHLALGCGRLSPDILWIRLHYAIKATRHCQQQLHASLTVPVYAPATLANPLSATTTATTSTAITPPSCYRATMFHNFSAFKAISSSRSRGSVLIPSTPPSLPPPPPPPPPTLPPSTLAPIPFSAPSSLGSFSLTRTTPSQYSFTSFLSASSPAPHPPPPPPPTLPTHLPFSTMTMLQTGAINSLHTAAQIESIVSNMGSSKQGHLCIYCGKVYSRKYGLKIHIRTHTGFKPLKCKYCSRPFGDPSNLNKHVRLHLHTTSSAAAAVVATARGAGTNGSNGRSGGGTIAYTCHVCQKTLTRRRDFQRHMELRHPCTSTTDESIGEDNDNDDDEEELSVAVAE